MIKSFVAIAVLSAVSSAFAGQNYLHGQDVVSAQSAPSISVNESGVYTVVAQGVNGVWVKHVLTPTTETRYGAFGEPVVKMEQIVPMP